MGHRHARSGELAVGGCRNLTAAVGPLRFHILAVGRARRGPEQDLYNAYVGRMRAPVALREVENRKAGTGRMGREAELLLKAVPKGATVVALDERGKALSSIEIAHRIAAWRDDGAGDIAFLIGGADGLDDPVRCRADLVLSLGPMTWPHLMVRAMLAEQLYRAQQILAGHPYHRE